MSAAPSEPGLLVVGAGISGLTVAAEMAASMPVTLIDRLPVAGGTRAGYEHPLARMLEQRCRSARVDFRLGTTALRWTRERKLLLAGPVPGFEWLAGRHLVFAGGVRPSTPTELRIAGDRVAGVLQGSVAYHLMEAGVRVGHRIVVIGGGSLARRACRLAKEQGSQLSVVDPDGRSEPPEACESWWPGWTPVELRGQGRVREIFLERAGARQRLLCDAVVLAARMRPLRSIEGAIFEDRNNGGVSFVQPKGDSIEPEQIMAEAKALGQGLSGLVAREVA